VGNDGFALQELIVSEIDGVIVVIAVFTVNWKGLPVYTKFVPGVEQLMDTFVMFEFVMLPVPFVTVQF
jgi:hypothetical protein